jgi:hypothetical protein
MKTTPVSCAMILIAVGLAWTKFAQADVFIVSPGTATSVEGNSANSYPFSIGSFGMRYQQVYGASDFSALSGPGLITQILFRPDATFGAAFTSIAPNVQIDLSTTSAAPDGLSTTFADNVGANDTVVFAGALTLSSAFVGPAGGPKDFDITISLLTPFLYDPAAGNLLLDVRNFAGATTTFFDAEFASGTSSRVSNLLEGVGAATGNADSNALVTEFHFSPVPEPSSWLLLGTCLAFAGRLCVPRSAGKR